MSTFLITWIVTAVSLVITANLVPGIHIATWQTAAIAALVFGLVNAIVKPILLFFTLPLTILTLGLFLFVVNAITFSLTAYFTGSGFRVDGFFPALFGAIVLSVISWGLNQMLGTQS